MKNNEHEPHVPIAGEESDICPICFMPISKMEMGKFYVRVINGKGAGLIPEK